MFFILAAFSIGCALIQAFKPLLCAFLQVDIRFPQPGADEPDRVTVTGLPDTVDNAIDHLLNLEDEYVSRRAAHDAISVFRFSI